MPRLKAEEVSGRIRRGEPSVFAFSTAINVKGLRILRRLNSAGDRGLPDGSFSKNRLEIAALIAADCVDYSEENNRLYITHDEGRSTLRCLEKMYTVNHE